MGYSILGIIVFLLLLVFISDLVRSRKDQNEEKYYHHLSNKSNFAYGEEFSEEFFDDVEDEHYYENKGDQYNENESDDKIKDVE